MSGARLHNPLALILAGLLCGACLVTAQPSVKAVLDALRAADPAAGLSIVPITPGATPSFPFVICYSCLCDVCLHIATTGLFAPVETSISSRYILTPDACSSGVVLDVGANIGYFSMLAAAAGCKVHAFEPNPAPRMLLHLNAMVNGVQGQVKIHGVAISAERTTGVMAAGRGEWGYGSVEAMEAAGAGAASTGLETFEMRPMTDFVQRDVLLLKVDTEGFEASVFEGAWGLLQRHKVHNVVVEVKDCYNPAKRRLMRRILVAGQFNHVYNYNEAYMQKMEVVEGPLLAPRILDTTAAIRDELSFPFVGEDFWFTMEPLPEGHFVPYTAPGATVQR